jgi:signal transduction histidine kinase
LTTIRLAGEVLYDQRKSFPPATARTAELLHAQTERFELLLADLLEMSRYDAGAVQLEVVPTNLVRLVEDAIVHGGDLDVWSEPGRGSCFRLTIPRHRGELLGGGSPLALPPDDELDLVRQGEAS